ncbi:MAG: LytR C-terminal domain-containing protein, partial [Patescibacteria group bacterium]|nr:LytR C-terminal domain-containing protein [Patescibacteria group bacterium]
AQSLLGNQKILSQSRQEQNKELSIAVYNGTLHEGLASAMAQTLAQYSYTITQVANARMRDYERTVIYPLTEKSTPEDVQFIREALNANVAALVPADILETEADLVIIVGEDNAPQ